MKYNSKKKDGFTLIEIIISIAIIGIISVAVYNSFGIMIKQTKSGQVKQTSALIGKQISEEVKSVVGEKITPVSSIYKITDNVKFKKSGDEYASEPLHFNEDGEIVDIESRYTGQVKLKPKLTNTFKTIEIEEFSKNRSDTVDNQDVFIIKDGTKIKAVNTKTDSSNIEEDTNIKISIINNGNLIKSFIKIDSNEPSEYTFEDGKTPIINLDLIYCKDEIKIIVDNDTKTPLNLCILNNNNAKVENTKGVLNEYYRSEYGNKIGVLYDVTVEILDNRSTDVKPIFQVAFTQNINME